MLRFATFEPQFSFVQFETFPDLDTIYFALAYCDHMTKPWLLVTAVAQYSNELCITAAS